MLSALKRIPKPILVSIKLLLSAALLIWLLRQTDLGAMTQLLHSLSLAELAVPLGLYILAQCASSMRWRILGTRLGLDSPLSEYIRLYFLGMYFNLFLPSTVGGDAVKSFLLGRQHNNQGAALVSVLMERSAGMAAMLAIGAVSLIFIPNMFPPTLNAFVALAGLAAAAVFLALPFAAHLLARYSPILADLSGFKERYGSWILVLVLAVLVQFCGMVATALVGGMLGIDAPLAFYCVSVALVSLIALIPISLNGLGLREAGFAMTLEFLSAPIEQAVALGLLTFAVQAAASLLGLPAFLTEKGTKDLPTTAKEPVQS